MATELFELDFTDGPAFAAHTRALGNLEHDYPWETLDPTRYPPLLVERARLGWTENAFNEFCTAAAMGQLVQAMAQARVPLDLLSLACQFPVEEVIHVELCARVAMRLGGGAPIAYDPEQLAIALDPSLTPLQRCSELVVRLCCVGEAISLPLLSGSMRASTHPLVRAVLTKIVQDEAQHGRLGFLYLDWIAPELDSVERDRLARCAAETLAHHAPFWEKLRSRSRDGMTSEGFQLAHVHELGWMESADYAALARRSISDEVLAPLAARGIIVSQ